MFISTSTGPMHLAGAVNIKTLSFFGDSLFASSKRWASVNDKNKQNNFSISSSYEVEIYTAILNCLNKIIKEEDISTNEDT